MVRMTETAASPISSYSGLGAAGGAGLVGNPASMDDYSSDFSVVSSPPTLNSEIYVNGSIGHFHDLHYDPASCVTSVASDLSFTQMQDAVQSLLQENAELKDVVQRDHATMKSQYEVMLQSKDQIEVFMSRQLEVRDMAKTAIERLKIENKELQEKLKSKEDQCALAGEGAARQAELDEMRALCASNAEELDRSQRVNYQLQAEMRELRTDYNQLKVGYDRLMAEKRELAAINFELQTKLCTAAALHPSFTSHKSLDSSEGSDDQNEFLIVERKSQRQEPPERKVVYLESTSQTTMVDEKAIENLEKQLIDEQERSQELVSDLNTARLKLEEMSKQIAGQEEVIRRLATKTTPPASPMSSTSFREGDSIESELKLSDEKAQMARAKLDKYRARCEQLDNWLGDQKPVENEASVAAAAAAAAELTKMQQMTEQLRAEVDNLKRSLAEEQVQKAANRKLAFDAQKALETTQAELKNFRQTIEEQSMEQVSKGRQSEAYYCLQAKTFQEKHDALYGELVTSQEALAKKETELKAALERLAQGATLRQPDDVETIEILRAQVDLYKADFQMERESREKLHEEKETILMQMKQLQLKMPGSKQKDTSRHERCSPRDARPDKKDKNSKPDKRNSRHAPEQQEGDEAELGAEGASGGPAEPDISIEIEFPFKCPKCTMGFKEYTPLERHVNLCLDLDNPFL